LTMVWSNPWIEIVSALTGDGRLGSGSTWVGPEWPRR